MKKSITRIVRKQLPRAIANRMKSTPPTLRRDAERMLKDIAFVLTLTRRIHDEMLNDPRSNA